MKKEFAFIILSLFLLSFISAELICPTGQVNDTYPGDCGLYTDTNSDKICDYSQETLAATTSLNATELHDLISGQELKLKTVKEVAEIYGICATEYSFALSQKYGFVINPSDSFTALNNKGVQPSVAKEVAESLIGIEKAQIEEDKPQIKTPTKEYYMWQTTLILVAIYLFSLYLVKKEKLSLVKNRKIWNMLLLISGIITAFTSIFLLLRLNYGITINFPLNIITVHVLAGYITLLIAIFHTLWHIPYYKSYFTQKKEKKSKKN
jgi:hypothetical protein